MVMYILVNNSHSSEQHMLPINWTQYLQVAFMMSIRRQQFDKFYQRKGILYLRIFKVFYEILNLDQFDLNEKYFAFSGIGNPKSFEDLLIKKNFNVINKHIYPDHYKYLQKDIDTLKKKANDEGAKLITTEKDYIKIPEKDKDDINCLKLGLEIDDEMGLLNFIKKKLNEKN